MFKKKTTRVRRKVASTVDEDADVAQAESKDTIMTPAEKAVRSAINWITKTNTPPGNIFEWTKKQMDSEKRSCPSFEMFKTKNRNQDIPCMEENRVKLKELADASKNYIHANYIKCPPSDRSYIATQHPLDSTIEDFWRMVFYENVDTVISLNGPDEVLPAYFPTEAGKFVNYGIFFVNNRRVILPTAKYTPTQYQIEILPEGCSNSRIVTILHYGYWPKSGVPTSPRVVMKILRLIKTDKTTNGPIVVHCANGINRAGCVIFSDILFDVTFRNIDPDIPSILKKLRSQRAQLLSNRYLTVFGINVFADYVKIRCKKFNLFPDLNKEIELFQASIEKEMKPLAGKEPSVASKKTKELTVDE